MSAPRLLRCGGTRFRCLVLGAAVATACIGRFAVADAATDPASVCSATKIRASATRSRALLTCNARALARAVTVDAACVHRADSAFDTAFAAADARGSCPHPGDVAAMRAASDDFVGGALAFTQTGDPGARCRVAVLAALARDLTRRAAAESSFKRQPSTPYRLVGARADAERALTLALASARCSAPLDVQAATTLVRGHVVNVVTALTCGDGARDPHEECDGADDLACPGACGVDCRCPQAPAAFACLGRSGPTITLAGTQPNHYQDLALAPATKLDARTASFSAGPDNLYPLNLGGGADLCVAGGVVQGIYDRTLDWQTMHDLNNAGMRTESARFTYDGPRIDDVTDALRPVGGPFTVRQAWISYARDDCIENDHLRAGFVVDSLLDGCYVALSERPSPQIVRERVDGRHGVLAIHRSLIRLAAMPGPRGGLPSDVGHGQFFKWDAHATALSLHDNVFLAERVAQGGAATMGVPDALVSCTNNVMVWLGGGPYPAPLPPCFTVTSDRGVWDDAVAIWKTRHAGVGGATMSAPSPS